MAKKKWLVTVQGWDTAYDPSVSTTSEVIELEEGQTPIHWFLSKPHVYSRFHFIPCALLGFWPVPENPTGPCTCGARE